MLAAVAQNRAKKQGKFDRVVGKFASRKGPPGIPAAAGPTSAAPAAGTKTVPAEEVKGKGREPGQFKYQAPAEDKELIQVVIDRSMESQVTMSQKELLAISPDVRRHMKEVITSKRVVQNTVEALLATVEVQAVGVSEQKLGTGGMVVGVDCLPLRCINRLVDGKYPVECTLDSGAQLIAMRRAIWMELLWYSQFPLKPTKSYNMVVADHSRSKHLGDSRERPLEVQGCRAVYPGASSGGCPVRHSTWTTVLCSCQSSNVA